MKDKFLEIWETAGGTNGEIVYEELVSRYSEKSRHYHTLNHISKSLGRVDEGKPKNKLALYMAIFFHDVIYDPVKNDNEEKSAEYFKKVAAENTVKSEIIDRTVGLIMATKHIEKPDNYDAMLICDIDLAELGKDYGHFENNNILIRKEFEMYSDEEYNQGRMEFMKTMSERPEIFFTAEFQQKYGKNAKSNVERFLIS